MFCAISGTSPLHPVVSTKSGLVYEKELIVKYLKDNDGKDPITGESLSESELIDIKTAPSAPAPPPRPPTLSSVPALLHTLQNEWDATMLEALELRKQNAALRQELSHALYKEDAAMRVLARIMRERDEAREALGSVRTSLGGGGGGAAVANGGAGGDVEMEEAGTGLSAQVIERIDATSATLSATRRKRKAPPGWATPDDLKSYTPTASIPSLHSTKPPGITCLDVAGEKGELLVTGGMDKNVQVYDRANDKVLATLKGHTKKINAVAVVNGGSATASDPPPLIASAGADKTVRLWARAEGGKSAYAAAGTLSSHGGEVTGVAVHPSNTLLLSGALDGSWAVHDLAHASGKPTTVLSGSLASVGGGEAGAASVAWHVDGQLFGVGATDGVVRVYDVKTAAVAATFGGHASGVVGLSFSENGYILASLSSAPSAEIKIWDLRKGANTHTIALGGGWTEGRSVGWDFSAQFLAVAGTELRVWQNKTWEELLRFDGNAAELTGVKVVDGGREVVCAGMDRTVRVLGKAA